MDLQKICGGSLYLLELERRASGLRMAFIWLTGSRPCAAREKKTERFSTASGIDKTINQNQPDFKRL
ncbi:hypothetical protein EO95_03520 [Methanosarcina sp. 1.H.T.1A.1]|nr:hypothetical protein EO95_03520 [Methanosarcina sp. 1.H.T.1A.1]